MIVVCLDGFFVIVQLGRRKCEPKRNFYSFKLIVFATILFARADGENNDGNFILG